jgi:two-component system NtrC family sensor kinase
VKGKADQLASLEELAGRSADGDERAFAEIYGTLLDPVFRYLYWNLGSREDAEDLCEDVFLRCLVNIGAYDPGRGPFKAWAFRIAHNLLVDHQRRRGRRAEEELRTMQEQLFRQDKLAAVGQLAAGIAHDINNPVGFVKSNLVSLRKYTSRLLAWVDTVDGEVLRWLPRRVKGELETRRRQLNMAYIRDDLPSVIDESLEGVERIRKIVSDLLSYARNDAEAVKPVDLLSCIDSSVSLLWNEIKHRCELIRECAPLPPVLCDPQRISQVFVNIISNALHALPPEGGRLTIQTLVEGESAVVRFIDNGSGIPADILTRIFDPFFTTKEPGKGTGLGLAISHQIVQRYGGSIEVESQEGSGTTFTIRLPVAMG